MAHDCNVQLEPTSQAEKLWSDLSLWDIRSFWNVVILRMETDFVGRRVEYAGRRAKYLIELCGFVRIHFSEENVVFIIMM